MENDELLYQIIKDTVETSKGVVNNTKIISDTSKEIMRVLQDIVPRLEVTEVGMDDLKDGVRESTKQAQTTFQIYISKIETLDQSFRDLTKAVEKVEFKCPAIEMKTKMNKWIYFIAVALVIENFILVGKFTGVDILGVLSNIIPGL